MVVSPNAHLEQGSSVGQFVTVGQESDGPLGVGQESDGPLGLGPVAVGSWVGTQTHWGHWPTVLVVVVAVSPAEHDEQGRSAEQVGQESDGPLGLGMVGVTVGVCAGTQKH
jgi:hypothetical protein